MCKSENLISVPSPHPPSKSRVWHMCLQSQSWGDFSSQANQSNQINFNEKAYIERLGEGGIWVRHTPLVPALRRQRQVDLYMLKARIHRRAHTKEVAGRGWGGGKVWGTEGWGKGRKGEGEDIHTCICKPVYRCAFTTYNTHTYVHTHTR